MALWNKLREPRQLFIDCPKHGLDCIAFPVKNGRIEVLATIRWWERFTLRRVCLKCVAEHMVNQIRKAEHG